MIPDAAHHVMEAPPEPAIAPLGGELPLPDAPLHSAAEPPAAERPETQVSPHVQGETTVSEPGPRTPAVEVESERELRSAAAETTERVSKEPVAKEPAAKEPEQPRRRSTVREPAPATLSAEPDAAAPAPVNRPPEPVVVVTSTSDGTETERPRRAGWWSKRVLGKG